MTPTRHFQVTLRRSPAGKSGHQRRVLAGMGLRRVGHVAYLRDTPTHRGMLYKVVHLLTIEPKEGPGPLSARSQARAKLGGGT